MSSVTKDALAFLLVNPPFGDIVAPKLANGWAIAADDDGNLLFNEESSKNGEIIWTIENEGVLDGDIWLLFGLADNVNSDGANVVVELTHQTNSTIIDFQIYLSSLSIISLLIRCFK